MSKKVIKIKQTKEQRNKKILIKKHNKLKGIHPLLPLVFESNCRPDILDRFFPVNLYVKDFIKKKITSKRWRSQKLFLTYLDCTLPLMEVLKALEKKFLKPKIINYALSIEERENCKNIRVYLEFDRRIDISNIHFFDLKGGILEGPLPKKSKDLVLIQNYIPDVSYTKKKLACIKYLVRGKNTKDSTLLISPALSELIS